MLEARLPLRGSKPGKLTSVCGQPICTSVRFRLSSVVRRGSNLRAACT